MKIDGEPSCLILLAPSRRKLPSVKPYLPATCVAPASNGEISTCWRPAGPFWARAAMASPTINASSQYGVRDAAANLNLFFGVTAVDALEHTTSVVLRSA